MTGHLSPLGILTSMLVFIGGRRLPSHIVVELGRGGVRASFPIRSGVDLTGVATSDRKGLRLPRTSARVARFPFPASDDAGPLGGQSGILRFSCRFSLAGWSDGHAMRRPEDRPPQFWP